MIELSDEKLAACPGSVVIKNSLEKTHGPLGISRASGDENSAVIGYIKAGLVPVPEKTSARQSNFKNEYLKK